MSSGILIVDDERKFRELVSIALTEAGYHTLVAADGREALARLESDSIDLVMTDIRMPHVDGHTLMKRIQERWPQIPVVVITAHASLKDAVRTIKDGAFDYLSKPFEIEELERIVKKAIAFGGVSRENARLRGELEATFGVDGLVGESSQLQKVRTAIAEVAPSRANVLLSGESGTGKEVVARAIHSSSPRRDRPFVAVNCAAIPESLLESELFGHVKGAFTGAAAAREGQFSRADSGTLFLDEIGDMPLAMQAKILRVLEDQMITPVGGGKATKVDVRIVAASNRDLASAIRMGQFREDLYYRLNVFPIVLPPLRERTEDIHAIVEYFVATLGASMGKGTARFSESALNAMRAYSWPGNVRELRNCVERTLISAKASIVDVNELPPYLAATTVAHLPSAAETSMAIPENFSLESVLDSVERGYILNALRESEGVQVKAAKLLGVKERSLWHRIKKLGIRMTRSGEL